MTLKETKLKLKTARSGKEITEALMDHFKTQEYYTEPKNPFLEFDGKI